MHTLGLVEKSNKLRFVSDCCASSIANSVSSVQSLPKVKRIAQGNRCRFMQSETVGTKQSGHFSLRSCDPES